MINDTLADQIIQTIEQMRGASRLINEIGGGDAGEQDDGGAPDRAGVRLSRDQLVKELADREEKLQSSSDDGVTDQYRCQQTNASLFQLVVCIAIQFLWCCWYRVYQYIIGELQSNRPLRLMVQASAGNGFVRIVSRMRCS